MGVTRRDLLDERQSATAPVSSPLPASLTRLRSGAVSGDDHAHGFDAVLDFLRRQHGFDFTVYKQVGLARGIRRRMEAVAVDDFGAYLERLERDPSELAALFDVLLINVTAFFRDPPAWRALASRLSPILDRARRTPVRMWSAGCASGEEAYTLAIVAAELVGTSALSRRVTIHATDVDDDALSRARRATYPIRALSGLSPALVESYFVTSGDGALVRDELRQAIVFDRHDLARDAPICGVDVIVCRNTLMYFNEATQSRILEQFERALAPRGLLLLGPAETLLTRGDRFFALDRRARVFSLAAPGVMEGPLPTTHDPPWQIDREWTKEVG